MRLIDADKITFFDCLAKAGNGVCCHAEGITCKEGIDMQPTVKAIPIEWLEQMWERDKDGFVDEYGVYHSSDDSLGESCKHVLENWNTNYKWKWVKENELDKM